MDGKTLQPWPSIPAVRGVWDVLRVRQRSFIGLPPRLDHCSKHGKFWTTDAFNCSRGDPDCLSFRYRISVRRLAGKRPARGQPPYAVGRPTVKIMSRRLAQAQGKTRYFTGKPCAAGHIAERRTRDCSCVVCFPKPKGVPGEVLARIRTALDSAGLGPDARAAARKRMIALWHADPVALTKMLP